MSQRCWTAFLVLIVLLLTSVNAQKVNFVDSITLEDVLRRVISTYPAISEARSRVGAAEAGIAKSKSLYYPYVNAIAQYTRIHPVSTFAGPGQPAITLFPPNNYNFEVSARMTVYDFGRRSLSVKSAIILHGNALYEEQRKMFDIALQTVETFNAIRMLQSRLELLDEESRDLHQHEHIAMVMEQSGTVTQLDVLTAQVRITGTENERAQSYAMLKGQTARLIELMGLSDSMVYAVGAFRLPSEMPNGQELIDTAFKNLPEVALANNLLSSARLEEQLARAGFWPQIDANAAYGFKNGYVPNINQIKANWLVGASLSAPVFNGFARLSQVRQTAENVAAAKSALFTVERNVRSSISGALEDLRAAWQQIPLSICYIEQARTTLSYAKARYESGSATILELLDAETVLAKARFQHLSAQYEASNRWFALQHAAGIKFW